MKGGDKPLERLVCSCSVSFIFSHYIYEW